ncbi:TPA: hypothetical protein QDC06_004564 [Burkholderia cepacia]|nr:hypothetical protein BZY94_30930 [Burkholderia territorii]HDR9501268.1 hypothetical protein [Burkholderia cepacia]
MMTLTQYVLIKIAEEAAEVAQIALKTAHFGLSETQPGRAETNAQRIYAELNDLNAMVLRLNDVAFGEFFYDPDHVAMSQKMAKVENYLAYSRSLGLVEPEATQQPEPRDEVTACAPIATVVKSNAGPELLINGQRIFSWLGTMYNDDADRIAKVINDAARAGGA